MPQLDFVSYYYQYNWLLISFFFVYIFLLKFVFPFVSLAMKMRNKRVLLDKLDLFNIEKKEVSSLEQYELLWELFLKIRMKQQRVISTVVNKELIVQTKKLKS